MFRLERGCKDGSAEEGVFFHAYPLFARSLLHELCRASVEVFLKTILSGNDYGLALFRDGRVPLVLDVTGSYPRTYFFAPVPSGCVSVSS